MSMHLSGALATRTAPLGDRCPIDRAMGVLGNRVTMLLLREAMYGVTRFDDFASLVGVTDGVAAQRLRELVDAGVLEKRPYREPGQRTRWEYVLTTSGHELLPVVLGLARWGADHAPGGAPAFTHLGCGETVSAAARCGAGHDVSVEDVRVGG